MRAIAGTGAIRSLLWLALFGAILAAWAWLYGMARMAGVDPLGRPVGMNMMDMTGFVALFAMWAVMMAAMMLPTMVPTLRAYEDLIASASGTWAGWIGVLAGYFVAWLAFAAAIAAAQVALLAAGAVDALGMASSPLLAGALLLAVGGYQFTAWKDVCHGVCHSPMGYFLGNWRHGSAGGLRMGMGLGSYCVGCCWGFMALGFVGGTMSLLWMGLATVYMVLEKLPQIAHHVRRPMGAALVAAGVALVVWGATGL